MAGGYVLSANGDGYTIVLDEASQFVTQAGPLTESTASTTSSLGSGVLSSTAFAGIGTDVGSASDLMHNCLVDGLTKCTGVLRSVTGDVNNVIDRYVAADKDVAASYAAQQTLLAQVTVPKLGTSKPHMGPGNEPPLPPFNVAKPTDADRKLYRKFSWGNYPYFGLLHQWWNAEKLFAHYLEATGTGYKVDPSTVMHDVPSFNKLVNDYVTQNKGHAFDSGWQNTSAIVNGKVESYDWYYGMDNWRYRVQSINDASGNPTSQYTVDIYKPYVFGDTGALHRLPLHDPVTGQAITQQQIENLNTVGLAQNFYITGQSTFTLP